MHYEYLIYLNRKQSSEKYPVQNIKMSMKAWNKKLGKFKFMFENWHLKDVHLYIQSDFEQSVLKVICSLLWFYLIHHRVVDWR